MLTAAGIAFFVVIPALLLAALGYSAYQEYRRDRVPILLYHRLISRAAAEQGLIPDKEMIYACYDTAFAEQMTYLRDAGYTAIDLDDYLAIRDGTRPCPARPIIITFDDGYSSNYSLAYPHLKRNCQKATIFVALDPDDHTRHLVTGIDDFLTADQMRELAANGVAIQSHTLTHCVLSEQDDAAAKFELTESQRRLTAITGRPVRHLAIPRAGYSRRIRRLVGKVGYRTACGNAKGSANLSSDLLFLPRLVIERDMTVADFVRCLSPRGALSLRLLGNLKRLPEHLAGPRLATRLRNVLYGSWLGPLFQTRNLKKVLAVGVLAYALGTVLFFLHLVVLK